MLTLNKATEDVIANLIIDPNIHQVNFYLLL